MKALKIMIVVFLALSISFSGIAQEQEKKDKKYYKKELKAIMDGLTEAQQMSIMSYATKYKKTDPKKEVLKMLKKMSPEDMAKVLAFSQKEAKVSALQKERLAKVTEAKNKVKRKAEYAPITKQKDVNKAAKSSNVAKTSMEVVNQVYDFGVITQGEKVSFEYTVKNTGKEPLIISNAKGSCGCTVPSWPKTPIASGDSAQIKVTFSSKGKKGKQQKRVTLTANTEPAQTYLTLKGEILVETPAKKVKNK